MGQCNLLRLHDPRLCYLTHVRFPWTCSDSVFRAMYMINWLKVRSTLSNLAQGIYNHDLTGSDDLDDRYVEARMSRSTVLSTLRVWHYDNLSQMPGGEVLLPRSVNDAGVSTFGVDICITVWHPCPRQTDPKGGIVSL